MTEPPPAPDVVWNGYQWTSNGLIWNGHEWVRPGTWPTPPPTPYVPPKGKNLLTVSIVLMLCGVGAGVWGLVQWSADLDSRYGGLSSNDRWTVTATIAGGMACLAVGLFLLIVWVVQRRRVA